MKIYMCHFDAQKMGGIVEYIAAMFKAFHQLGHEVDIVILSTQRLTENRYRNKIKDYAKTDKERGLLFDSQAAGYEKDAVTGYYRNNYYGYYVPPKNKICVFDEDSVQRFHDRISDADIIIWHNTPTHNERWEHGDASNWWRYFDLPSSIMQMFAVHDAYFDIRASFVSAFKEKISLLLCAHGAAYKCCEHIGIPRVLMPNPRYFGEEPQFHIIPYSKRTTDFFAAQMFKAMKRVQDIIAAIPYLKTTNVTIAGAGVEYCCMLLPWEKTKADYRCRKKRDPDLPQEYEDNHVTLWQRAKEYGINHIGQLSGSEVNRRLLKTKFALDASYCKHYAPFARTHINGFIIEAMMNGAYPVLRDYYGCTRKKCAETDAMYERVRAHYIPSTATPKEFAEHLEYLLYNTTQTRFEEDTMYNFVLAYDTYNAVTNAEKIISCKKRGRGWIKRAHECGQDSDAVVEYTEKFMQDYFKIPLPLQFETE